MAVTEALPPTVIAVLLLESTAMPQRRLIVVLPMAPAAPVSLPMMAADTLVPSGASTHRSETRLANWATALAVAVGALDRNRFANHIGWT